MSRLYSRPSLKDNRVDSLSFHKPLGYSRLMPDYVAVTHETLVAARDSLPVELQPCITAVTIRALLNFTAERGGTVPVVIPQIDLEPMLVSRFLTFDHLEELPGEPVHFHITITDGELL